MSNEREIEDLFSGGGAPALKFPTIGTKYVGTITGLESRQQRDFTSGELVTWDDGKPKMELVVTLATDERDPEVEDDDGARRLFVKAQLLTSLREAVKKVGAKAPEVGGRVAVAYVSDGEPQKKGWNPPKQYACAYEPPARKEVEDLFSTEQTSGDEAAAPGGGFDPAGLAGLLSGA